MIDPNFKENQEIYQTQDVAVPEKNELRIIYEAEPDVRIRVLEGSAEMFGMKLTNSYYEMPLASRSVYVYATTPCIMRVCIDKSKHVQFYVQPDEEGAYASFVALNYLLDKHRKKSKAGWREGPRVVVTGGEGVGKSVATRTLINFALRNDHVPILVDLDCDNSELSHKGTVAAASVERQMPFDFTNAPKLAYFFGHTSITNRLDHYLECVKTLVSAVDARLEGSTSSLKEYISSKKFMAEERALPDTASGMFFNLPTEATDLSAHDLCALLDAVRPHYILVLQNDALLAKLREIKDRGWQLIRRPALSGALAHSADRRRYLSAVVSSRYFYSDAVVTTFENIDADAVHIVQIDSLGTSPLGYIHQHKGELRLIKIDPHVVNLRDKRLALLNLEKDAAVTVADVLQAEVQFLTLVQQVSDNFLSFIRPKNVLADLRHYVLLMGTV